jgi:hypothetical protein
MNDIRSPEQRSAAMRRLAGLLFFALIGAGPAPQASFASSDGSALFSV